MCDGGKQYLVYRGERRGESRLGRLATADFNSSSINCCSTHSFNVLAMWHHNSVRATLSFIRHVSRHVHTAGYATQRPIPGIEVEKVRHSVSREPLLTCARVCRDHY